MGYDNNTPLTGVTGSGLPADIWHETMARVLVGLTPTALPMQVPPQAQAIAPVPQQGEAGDGLGFTPQEADNIINDLSRQLQQLREEDLKSQAKITELMQKIQTLK